MKYLLPFLLLLAACGEDPRVKDNKQKFDAAKDNFMKDKTSFDRCYAISLSNFNKKQIDSGRKYRDSCVYYHVQCGKWRDSCIKLHDELVKIYRNGKDD